MEKGEGEMGSESDGVLLFAIFLSQPSRRWVSCHAAGYMACAVLLFRVGGLRWWIMDVGCWARGIA